MSASKLPLIIIIIIVAAIVTFVIVALLKRNSRPRYWIHPRPLTSRVRGDFKALSKSIAAYQRDHGAWPPGVPLETALDDKAAIAKAGGTHLASVSPGSRDRYGQMAPIRYTKSIPSDPFFLRELGSVSDYGVPHAYFAGGKSFVLFSTGPDGVYNIQPGKHFDPDKDDSPTSALLQVSYDPTNGSISPGDLWHIGIARPEN